MLQKTLALLHRSLRTDARLLRMHLFRGGLIAIVLLSLLQTQDRFLGIGGSPGLELFARLMGGNFWFITLATGFYFATAVTEEKEEQTLGLLRLAGISPAALLLGKWLPRVIGGLLLIAVQVPFTLLSITLGGVLIHQVLAAYCTLAAYLVLCGSLGLFASVVCSRSGAAVTVAFVLLSLFFMLMPVWDAVIAGWVAIGVLPAGWLDRPAMVNAGSWHLSALQRLEDIKVTGFDERLIGFQVVSNVALAVVLGVASWLLFDRMTRNETAAIGGQVQWIARLTRLGRAGSRRAWSLPIVWKDFYQFAGGGWTVVKFFAYPVMLIVVALFIGAGRFTAKMVGGYMMGFMLWVLLLEVSILTARTFRDEVKAQTWPLLVLLPRSVGDVCYAKIAGGLLGLAPAGFYFLLGALLEANDVNNTLDSIFDNADALLMFTYVVLQFVLFWHLAALLSIVWRWAAWPLAVFFAGVFVFVGNGLLIACLATGGGGGPGSEEALLVFLCFIAAGLVFAVHVWIGMALERVAGE